FDAPSSRRARVRSRSVVSLQDRRCGRNPWGQQVTLLLRLTAELTWSHELLEPQGFRDMLELLITRFRNRAAHIDKLGKDDYVRCRELIIGSEGALWKLVRDSSAQNGPPRTSREPAPGPVHRLGSGPDSCVRPAPGW